MPIFWPYKAVLSASLFGVVVAAQGWNTPPGGGQFWNYLYSIDVHTNEIAHSVELPSPYGAVSPNQGGAVLSIGALPEWQGQAPYVFAVRDNCSPQEIDVCTVGSLSLATPISIDLNPSAVAVAPNNAYVYVGGGGALAAYTPLPGGSLQGSVTLPGFSTATGDATPNIISIVVTPDNNFLYVLAIDYAASQSTPTPAPNAYSAGAALTTVSPGCVYIVGSPANPTAPNTVIATIPLAGLLNYSSSEGYYYSPTTSPAPKSMQITPNGDYVYVASGTGMVYVISTSTQKVETILGCAGPLAALASPAGDAFYVMNYGSAVIQKFDVGALAVESSAIGPMAWGEGIYGTGPIFLCGMTSWTITPDGQHIVYENEPFSRGYWFDSSAYWLNDGPYQTINILDTSTMEFLPPISSPTGWDSVALCNNDYAFVVNTSGDICAYDLATGDLASSTPFNSSGFVMVPDGEWIYAGSVGGAGNGNLQSYETSTGTVTTLTTYGYETFPSYAVTAVSPDSAWAVLGGPGYYVGPRYFFFVVDVQNNRFATMLPASGNLPAGPTAACFVGDVLYIALSNATVSVWTISAPGGPYTVTNTATITTTGNVGQMLVAGSTIYTDIGDIIEGTSVVGTLDYPVWALKPFTTAANGPPACSVSADGASLYTPGYAIDLSTMAETSYDYGFGTGNYFGSPTTIGFTPNADYCLVTTVADFPSEVHGQLVVLSLGGTGSDWATLQSTATVGDWPCGVVASADSTTAWVANQRTLNVSVMSVPSGDTVATIPLTGPDTMFPVDIQYITTSGSGGSVSGGGGGSTGGGGSGSGGSGGGSGGSGSATVPGAPTGLTATAGDTEVALDWDIPSSDGGEPITEYEVYSGTSSSSLVLNSTTTGTTYTVTGLTDGTAYYFAVAAVNSVGEGPQSGTVSATPTGGSGSGSGGSGSGSGGSGDTVPGAPTGLTATGEDAEVALAWDAPSSDGGATITEYKVYSGTSSGSLSLNSSTSSTDETVTGLTNGTLYYFAVSAVNSVGEGDQSSQASATPTSGSGSGSGSGGAPNPDFMATGAAPTMPFPNSPWTTTIPSSPSLASNSDTLVDNFVSGYTSQYGTVNVNGNITRYVVHGNSISPWTTVSINPDNSYSAYNPSGTMLVPLPPDMVATTSSDNPLVIWDVDNQIMYCFWVWTSSNSANTCQVYSTSGSWTAGFGDSSSSSDLSFTTTASGAPYGACTMTLADALYGTIEHALGLIVGNAASGGPVAPAVTSDGSTSIADGGIPEGSLFFFPSDVSMPSGLSSFAQMVFTAIQRYGMYAVDQTGGSGFDLYMEYYAPWGLYEDGNAGDVPSNWPYSPGTAYAALDGMPWSELQVLAPPE